MAPRSLPDRLLGRLHRAFDLRPGEARPLIASFAYFFLLLGGYYLLRPVRDEMGIQGGVEKLPWLFTATFLVMLAAVPAYGKLAAKLPRRRFLPLVYHFFAANLAAFVVLFHLDLPGQWVPRIFFVWVSVFNLFAVSAFWSLMSDVFSNAQGRRLFGAVAAGGTTGAIAGPALAGVLAPVLGPANLLLFTLVAVEGAVFCLRDLERHPPPQETDDGGDGRERGGRGEARNGAALGGSPFAGFRELAGSPYLLGIAGYILLYTVTSTFVYFEQARIVRDATTDEGVRTAIFAGMDFATNALTLAVQAFVTGRLIGWLGIAFALGLLPAVTAAGFGALAAAPALWVLAVFQVVRRAGSYAVARPAREVLFTVVSRSERYKAKSFIDTVVYRFGDVIGAWLFAGLGALGLGLTAIALAGVPIAVAWSGVGRALGRREDVAAKARQGKPARPGN